MVNELESDVLLFWASLLRRFVDNLVLCSIASLEAVLLNSEG
jgi:hypothetical protein